MLLSIILAQTKKNKLNYFSSALLSIFSKFHFTSRGSIEEIDTSENTAYYSAWWK